MPNKDEFKKNAEDAAHQAKAKAGQVAHDNRDKLAGMLGKLTSKIDEKTQGKYHDKLAKAQDAALKGADKLAEQRPDAGSGETPIPPASGDTPNPPAPGQTPPPAV